MSSQLIPNELLAFLQQKLDVMDELSAIQICSTNFSQEEIAASKRLLYDVLNKSDQMVSRRRAGTKKSIQDVITLLKSPPEPPHTPTPASLAPTDKAGQVSRPVTLLVPAAPVKLQSTPRRSFTSVTLSAPTAPPKPIPQKVSDPDADGFVTVLSRKHRPRTKVNRCGTATVPVQPIVELRAAIPTTPMYVSRLNPTTKAEIIVEYVRKRINHTSRVQLLESSRNVSFRSFVVQMPKSSLPLVMVGSFWPQGVVFRRFRGQLPPERKKT